MIRKYYVKDYAHENDLCIKLRTRKKYFGLKMQEI